MYMYVCMSENRPYPSARAFKLNEQYICRLWRTTEPLKRLISCPRTRKSQNARFLFLLQKRVSYEREQNNRNDINAVIKPIL